MEESWDAENFEPKLPTTLTNKWEGEDEDDDVKESWEDDEEEKKDEEKKEITAPPPSKPKKNKLSDKIAEKEKQERLEQEKRLAEKEAALTHEERLAEKLRLKKLEEEEDLRVALETLGVTDGAGGKLDSFHPTNQEEFEEFADLLSKKITIYKAHEEFAGFVEDLFRNITVQMSSLDIKRLKATVDNVYIEKQKTEKSDKNKKAGKGKGKAKLRVEGDNAHLNQYDTYGNYEQDYDDFI